MNRFRLAAGLGPAAIAAAAALAAPCAAAAAVVLSDNFDSDTQALNWAGDATFVSKGGASGNASVDLIGNNGPFPYCEAGAANQCVDLDGSTGSGNFPAGKLVSTTKFVPGDYTLEFDLAGNQRGAPAETTVVKMDGLVIDTLTLSSDAPWKTYSFTFDAPNGGKLKFKELGPSDQQGNVLDNVVLSTDATPGLEPDGGGVPEPATWTMMILGAGAVGAMGRRSRRLRSLATA